MEQIRVPANDWHGPIDIHYDPRFFGVKRRTHTNRSQDYQVFRKRDDAAVATIPMWSRDCEFLDGGTEQFEVASTDQTTAHFVPKKTLFGRSPLTIEFHIPIP